jgi:transcriptional regulator with XRE-family HTH domain
MCGVSYANISRLESGRQKAQGETVIKLASALGAQWRELLREPLRPLEETTME